MPPKTDPNLVLSYEEQLKAANEAVYKHGIELAVKNKTLSLLSKLYEIATLALERAEMAQRVTQTIQSEFEFEIVALFGYDASRNVLTPLSEAFSTRVKETGALTIGETSLETGTLISEAIKTKESRYTENLSEVCTAELLQETCAALQSKGFVRSSLVFPLITNQTVIGVLLLSLNRTSSDLIVYELEAMKNFVNVIAISLDKVMLYEQLKLANAQQENLLHFISHEIKGYLTKSEAGFAAIAEGDYGPVSPQLKDMAALALVDTRKGVSTVMDILDASNLKKGTVAFKKELFDLKTAVVQVVEEQKKIADEKGLLFGVTIQDGSYSIRGDEERLREHVIRNLIDNAIKYTPSGTVHIELSRTNASIRLSIQDQGVGITPEDMQRLFTEGGHGKDSIKINTHSTGYGLFIAKTIVDAHGGKIWAESEGAGKGSRFIIEFPIAS